VTTYLLHAIDSEGTLRFYTLFAAWLTMSRCERSGTCLDIHTHGDLPSLLQILGYTALLVQFLGPSVFVGLAAMLVILPLNAHFLRR
jgi:uncharacterized protein (DUF983 family)